MTSCPSWTPSPSTSAWGKARRAALPCRRGLLLAKRRVQRGPPLHRHKVGRQRCQSVRPAVCHPICAVALHRQRRQPGPAQAPAQAREGTGQKCDEGRRGRETPLQQLQRLLSSRRMQGSALLGSRVATSGRRTAARGSQFTEPGLGIFHTAAVKHHRTCVQK